MKRKKTEIVKKSNNPAFQVEIFFISSQKSKRHQPFFSLPQESFNFKADEKDIETFGVRVTAMQHLNFPEKGKNEFLAWNLLGHSVYFCPWKGSGFYWLHKVGNQYWLNHFGWFIWYMKNGHHNKLSQYDQLLHKANNSVLKRVPSENSIAWLGLL